MATKVQICNMALSRLGASTITALTDDTPEAKLCNTLFDDLSDRVLMQGSWAVALVRVALAKTTNTPPYGFANEFQLPVDPKCLKVLTTDLDVTPLEDISASGSFPYRIEGDKLLTDSTNVKIKYISRLASTERYDPLLTEAVEVLLASYLAFPIMGERIVAEQLKQEYLELVNRNLAIDGQQGTKSSIVTTDLTTDVR